MFTDHPNDLARTLSEMERIARDKCNYNQTEAREKFKEFLGRDRRFDNYDKAALVERVMLCRSNGAVLDLGDPRLKGLPPRPLDKSNW